MPRSSAIPLALLLVACGGAADSAPLQGGDSCTLLASGTWTFSGAAWGMGDESMDGELTLDAESCTFTLHDWSMAMDDLPTGGALDGDALQFDGLTSRWRTCTGTTADEYTASGTCSEDDSAWAIVYVGG